MRHRTGQKYGWPLLARPMTSPCMPFLGLVKVRVPNWLVSSIALVAWSRARQVTRANSRTLEFEWVDGCLCAHVLYEA